MNPKSRLGLLILLAIPILLFFFLKFFGRNKFDVPVFYETAVDWPVGCPEPASFPFLVDSLVADFISNRGPVVYLLDSMPSEAFLRWPNEIDTSRIRMAHLFSGPFTPCDFGATPGTEAVLVDSDRRVRGLFRELDREEMDRLIMETKILLNDY